MRRVKAAGNPNTILKRAGAALVILIAMFAIAMVVNRGPKASTDNPEIPISPEILAAMKDINAIPRDDLDQSVADFLKLDAETQVNLVRLFGLLGFYDFIGELYDVKVDRFFKNRFRPPASLNFYNCSIKLFMQGRTPPYEQFMVKSLQTIVAERAANPSIMVSSIVKQTYYAQCGYEQIGK